MADRTPIDVALVATSPDGDESLALGYLAASLRRAGHVPHVTSFAGASDLEVTARRLVAIGAPLVGVGLPSGVAAIDVLALCRRVRELGYRGHITAGGPFATVARHRLLAEYSALDSVVRHAGEIPIVMLADEVARGEPLAALPGVTTRAGDGLPAPAGMPDLGSLRPERTFGRLYAGVPQARISAVRGCWGRCRYCGLAAVQAQARDEALRGGMTCEEIRAAGIGSLRRRPVADVAAEMADLYHEHGVRYFHFVDENHLPSGSAAAAGVLDDLTDELAARRVGPRAISMMLRADAATGPVVEAMARLGVVRSLLGVESMRAEGLARLGRGGRPHRSREAIERLTRAGVSFHFNLLLCHPDSTIATIDEEIRALRDVVAGGLLDPFQVEVLEGTDLFRRLERAGRLEGGPLLWHAWPEDAPARRFAVLLSQLKRRAIGHIALTPLAHEVLGELVVSRQLGRLRSDTALLAREAARLVRAHNELWVRLLEGASDLAKDPSRGASDAFVLAAQRDAARLALELERLRAAVTRACAGSLHSDVVFPRTARAAAVALAVLAGSCQSSSTPAGQGGGSTGSSGAVAPEPASSESAPVGTEAPPSTLPARDAHSSGADAAGPTKPAPPAKPAQVEQVAPPTPDRGCDEGSRSRQRAQLVGLDRTSACVDDMENGRRAYRFVLDATGRVIGMEMEDGSPVPDDVKRCYLRVVGDQRFPCVGERFWIHHFIALK